MENIKLIKDGDCLVNLIQITFTEEEFDIVKKYLIRKKIINIDKPKKVKQYSKAICKLVCEDKCDKEKVFAEYPLIKDGYELLGSKKLKALGYNSFKIKNELNNLDNQSEIEDKIKSTFEADKFYSAKDVKAILTTLYKNAGISKKAKSTDIENILNTRLIQKKINSKNIKGYQL